jgi:hypothetical protein
MQGAISVHRQSPEWFAMGCRTCSVKGLIFDPHKYPIFGGFWGVVFLENKTVLFLKGEP